FGFVAVKLVRGVDLLWTRIRRGRHAQPATAPTQSGVGLATPAGGEQPPDPGRRFFFRAATAAAGATPFLGAMYGYAAERLNYQVRREEIPISNLNPALEGLSIVQISDIHQSAYMPR